MKLKFKGNKMYDRVKGVVVKNGDVIQVPDDSKMLTLHPGLFDRVGDDAVVSELESSNLLMIDPRLLKPKGYTRPIAADVNVQPAAPAAPVKELPASVPPDTTDDPDGADADTDMVDGKKAKRGKKGG